MSLVSGVSVGKQLPKCTKWKTCKFYPEQCYHPESYPCLCAAYTHPNSIKYTKVYQQTCKSEGVKHDTGKPDWTLLPWRQVEDVVRVLQYGASKYPEADNWQRVDKGRTRYFAAAIRHLVAWAGGEYADKESGLPHLSHAACCVLFLAWHNTNTPKE